MFLGEYNHSIDAKGRLIVPAKFREELGTSVVVTRGLDGCLFAYSKEAWHALEEVRILLLQRDLMDVYTFIRTRNGRNSRVN